MTRIIFRTSGNRDLVVDAEDGATIMEAAVRNGVEGIVAECGGACSCATCHVRVDADWFDRVGDPSPMEEDMLSFASERGETSRLSCQLRVSPELDCIVVWVPSQQG